VNYNLRNETKYNLSEVEGLISEFFPYAQKRLGFDKPVNVKLISDLHNAADSLGKTGAYSPQMMEITIYVDKRHPKDILRSFSHELIHHSQNCRGEFDRDMNFGEGYAQVDEHMRKMEQEAYLEGQMNLRDWENTRNITKENKVMSEVNLEEAVRQAVRTAFKRILEKKENGLKEGSQEYYSDGSWHSGDPPSTPAAAPGEYEFTQRCKEKNGTMSHANSGALICMDGNRQIMIREEEFNEEEIMEEEVVDEMFDTMGKRDDVVEEEELYETFTSQKNKMLFEQLTKKWAK